MHKFLFFQVTNSFFIRVLKGKKKFVVFFLVNYSPYSQFAFSYFLFFLLYFLINYLFDAPTTKTTTIIDVFY